MNAILPTKASAALRTVFPVPLPGGATAEAGPYTLGRLVLLFDLGSPLVRPAENAPDSALVLRWCATLRIMLARHPEAEARAVAIGGVAEYLATSLPWAEELFGTAAPLGAIADAVEALKAELARIWALDAPDDVAQSGGAGTSGGAPGEAARPGMASSPPSSAMPSPAGAGASSAP